MSKRAEDLAKQLYPDPKLENYDDILVYRADRDNASMGRINVVRVYEQAEKDLGWHPSTEHPPVDEEVIVLLGNYDDFPQIAIGHTVDTEAVVDIYGNPYKIIEYNGWNIPGVKYWMPMPKLPNEDE